MKAAGAMGEGDPIAELTLQRGDQGVTTGLVADRHATQVSGEMALAYELGHGQLLEHRYAAVAQLLGCSGGGQELGWKNQIAESKGTAAATR